MKVLLSFLSLITLFSILTGCASSGPWQAVSPDGNVAIEVNHLAETGGLTYTVRLNGQIIVEASPLGIERDDQSFVEGLKLTGRTKNLIDESYTMLHGKRSECRGLANELTLTYENETKSKIEVVLRAYDEGVAFRYRFPERDETMRTVKKELTGFRIPMDGVGYLLPHDDAGQWWPAYENVFQNGIAVGEPSPKAMGWDLPALFKVNNRGWVLITESDLDENYCGFALEKESPEGLYQLRFPDPMEGWETGDIHPKSSLPWQTPWRVLMVGDSPGDMVESSLVTHLAAPSKVKNTDWIKPGRASWGWWSDSDNPTNLKSLKSFVDLAVDMGWEYSLVDANWNKMPERRLKNLVSYAEEKGVGLLFWYNSGGPHNIVSEEPRDRMHEREIRRQEFKWLRELGIKGVKIDFWHSDKQNVIRQYIEVLEDAADFEIMVNTHGCTLPRGWERTYPHLMSMESVKGAEAYKFSETYPDEAVWHNTVLPFTRNAVGPMDYTPVAFSDHKFPHKTTWGHELALSVIFESGWQHFADKVKAYQKLPAAPKRFLKDVPVAWDDVHYIAGEPGRFVALARRNGDTWYVAGINGEDRERAVALDFPFIGEGKWRGVFIEDGEGKGDFVDQVLTTDAGSSEKLTLKPFGGFVIQLFPESS